MTEQLTPHDCVACAAPLYLGDFKKRDCGACGAAIEQSPLEKDDA